jgi:hypothetical protein
VQLLIGYTHDLAYKTRVQRQGAEIPADDDSSTILYLELFENLPTGATILVAQRLIA